MITKKLNIGDSTYILKFDEFDEDVEIDNLLKIDYSNLLGEMISFPTVVAKFGNMLAEAESQVSERKLDLDVLEAKLKEKYRIELSEANGGKQPTVDQLNMAIIGNKVYIAKKKAMITAQKTRDYMFTTYLAAKDKSEKINKVFTSATPTDIPDSVIEGRMNSTMIKKAKQHKLID